MTSVIPERSAADDDVAAHPPTPRAGRHRTPSGASAPGAGGHRWQLMLPLADPRPGLPAIAQPPRPLPSNGARTPTAAAAVAAGGGAGVAPIAPTVVPAPMTAPPPADDQRSVLPADGVGPTVVPAQPAPSAQPVPSADATPSAQPPRSESTSNRPELSWAPPADAPPLRLALPAIPDAPARPTVTPPVQAAPATPPAQAAPAPRAPQAAPIAPVAPAPRQAPAGARAPITPGPPSLSEPPEVVEPPRPGRRELRRQRRAEARRAAEAEREARAPKPWTLGLLEWIGIVAAALVGALLIKVLLMQAFVIPSPSMEPTLGIGNRVLVVKPAFLTGEVERGDVIVFKRPKALQYGTDTSDLIKRVVAIGGDTVEAIDGEVYVNGERLPEGWLLPGTLTDDFGPVDVPPGHYWMMGDNRGNSQDSRYFGPLAEDQVIGEAVLRWWPLSRWAWL